MFLPFPVAVFCPGNTGEYSGEGMKIILTFYGVMLKLASVIA